MPAQPTSIPSAIGPPSWGRDWRVTIAVWIGGLLLAGCTGTSAARPTEVTAKTELKPRQPRQSASSEGEEVVSVVSGQRESDFGIQAEHRETPVPAADSLVDPILSDAVALPDDVLSDDILPDLPASVPAEELETLIALAESSNPQLRRLQQESAAAWAKVRYVDKLPDPTIGANVFGNPIETAAGSQRASLTVMQMIPWLSRLDAKSQQAAYEAMVAQQTAEAERLSVIEDVRIGWYKLYVLGKQIETTHASQQLLETLAEVATARVATGEATQGDVLRATLELSRLREQLVTLEQQAASTRADLNRRIGRESEHPIPFPEKLEVELPEFSHASLLETARQRQPEIAAAQLRTSATRWGLEVARLEQRPDVSISATWFAIDDNRPASPIVDVGRDAWAVGAQVSVPLWHNKYRAMRDEATWSHFASHAGVNDVVQRYDAVLRDLLAQAESAEEIATLYRETIIPQARQTLETDQRAFAENLVEFDRIIQDFRNLLVLELEYQEALGRLAIALARIEQVSGTQWYR